jgi:phenylalanine-4-hydroxylase
MKRCCGCATLAKNNILQRAVLGYCKKKSYLPGVYLQLYWFTIEFGICVQHGNRKAYGAGLLSSFGELEYSLSDKPAVDAFDPAITAVTEYPITKYQPKYFLANSFADAKIKLM